MNYYDTPTVRGRWTPTPVESEPLDFANADSGFDLVNVETGERIELSNAQALNVMASAAERAADRAEQALARLEGRSGATLDLSNAAESEPEIDDDDLALARWDAEG